MNIGPVMRIRAHIGQFNSDIRASHFATKLLRYFFSTGVDFFGQMELADMGAADHFLRRISEQQFSSATKKGNDAVLISFNDRKILGRIDNVLQLP